MSELADAVGQAWGDRSAAVGGASSDAVAWKALPCPTVVEGTQPDALPDLLASELPDLLAPSVRSLTRLVHCAPPRSQSGSSMLSHAGGWAGSVREAIVRKAGQYRRRRGRNWEGNAAALGCRGVGRCHGAAGAPGACRGSAVTAARGGGSL